MNVFADFHSLYRQFRGSQYTGQTLVPHSTRNFHLYIILDSRLDVNFHTQWFYNFQISKLRGYFAIIIYPGNKCYIIVEKENEMLFSRVSNEVLTNTKKWRKSHADIARKVASRNQLDPTFPINKGFQDLFERFNFSNKSQASTTSIRVNRKSTLLL